MCDSDTKPTSSSSLPPGLNLLDSSLRFAVIPLGVASLWLTLTNHEKNNDYGDLAFHNFSGLKYMVMAYLMITSGGAVIETVYLAYKGDVEVAWSEACSSYGRFCAKTELALLLHFLSLSCFIVLAVISAYRAFSIFEPPVTIQMVEEQAS